MGFDSSDGHQARIAVTPLEEAHQAVSLFGSTDRARLNDPQQLRLYSRKADGNWFPDLQHDPDTD